METIEEIMKREGLKKPVKKPMAEPLREYDEHGNYVHYKDNDGFEVWGEYDEHGDLVHYKNSKGHEWVKENGHMLLKRPDGTWYMDGVILEKKQQEDE